MNRPSPLSVCHIDDLQRSRRGIALAVVLAFVLTTLAFAGAMFMFRTEVKQLNVVSVNFLQANFLAQSAIQHALMKFHTLPQEGFDVGLIAHGYCPFRALVRLPGATGATGLPTPGTRSNVGLELFRQDCSTDFLGWNGLPGVTAENWKYRVASMSVIAAFTDQATKDLVLTVRITAIGSVNDPRDNRGWRHETMTKTIELRRPQRLQSL